MVTYKNLAASVCIFVYFCIPSHAGMDSAGVSTLGGEEQTDIQTHGGGVSTSGGALDLSGGDVLDAGQVGATAVEASTIQGGNVMVTGSLSNPSASAVAISDSVTISGQADAIRFKVSELTPSANSDATSKHYVDSQIAAAQDRVLERVSAAQDGALYYCDVTGDTTYSGEKSFYTTNKNTANTYHGKTTSTAVKVCTHEDDWGRCRGYTTYTVITRWACSTM